MKKSELEEKKPVKKKNKVTDKEKILKNKKKEI